MKTTLFTLDSRKRILLCLVILFSGLFQLSGQNTAPTTTKEQNYLTQRKIKLKKQIDSLNRWRLNDYYAYRKQQNKTDSLKGIFWNLMMDMNKSSKMIDEREKIRAKRNEIVELKQRKEIEYYSEEKTTQRQLDVWNRELAYLSRLPKNTSQDIPPIIFSESTENLHYLQKQLKIQQQIDSLSLCLNETAWKHTVIEENADAESDKLHLVIEELDKKIWKKRDKKKNYEKLEARRKEVYNRREAYYDIRSKSIDAYHEESDRLDKLIKEKEEESRQQYWAWKEPLTKQFGNGNDKPENLFFYHYDAMGNVVAITDGDGNLVQHMEYTPTGEVFLEERNKQYNTNQLFAYTELDRETGLYYAQNRYYNPREGVFLSVDPLAEKMPSWSPYSYGFNNPVRFIDPTGLSPESPPSTDVIKNKDGSYTVVGAKNDGDTNIYLVNDKGQRTGEVIGQTNLPTDFMQTNNITGKFEGHLNSTFNLNQKYDMRISGKMYKNVGGDEIKDIYTSLFNSLTNDKGWWDSLKYLRDNSGNGKKFDIKASVAGFSPEDVVLLGGKYTTVRGLGNEIFGANMRSVLDKTYFDKDFFYNQVMRKVGDYNQSQNKGATGYNSGWPFYGEHTFSGSYIYRGYYGRFPYRTDIKY